MKYDFDTPLNRRGTNSYKWDVAEHELPMWVADMDFATAPAVTQAILDRAANPAYGYNIVPDALKDAYIGWWERRHHVTFERDWIVFSTGVVPSLSSLVRKMTTPGENVLILTPVYNIFYNSILNNGAHVQECPLVYRDGIYSIDWELLEHCMADPQTSLMFLCNPQNPSGNIWDRETLARIGSLSVKHHVLVIADEIHCDLLDPGYDYVPYASASEECLRNSITLIAPTKTFNMAGLQTSVFVAADPVIRHKAERGLNTDECAEPNTFAVDAAIAAFTQGEEWLEELRAYLAANKAYVIARLEKELPQVRVVRSHATYLMWIDCKSLQMDAKELSSQIREKTGLYLSAGNAYGGNGAGFLRLNVACARCVLEDGINRLVEGIQSCL